LELEGPVTQFGITLISSEIAISESGVMLSIFQVNAISIHILQLFLGNWNHFKEKALGKFKQENRDRYSMNFF
jgi:hypothetical protein